MSDDEDKVTRLPIKFRTPPGEDEPMLKVVEQTWRNGECNHRYRIEGVATRSANYLIREGETEVECGLCGMRLDPMFVLRILAREETKWQRSREQYTDEMRRLSERQRTKCQHCGSITRISRS